MLVAGSEKFPYPPPRLPNPGAQRQPSAVSGGCGTRRFAPPESGRSTTAFGCERRMRDPSLGSSRIRALSDSLRL